MSKRDGSAGRRMQWAAGTAAVLALGTGTAAAHAVWESTAALPPQGVSSGSLALSTQWVGGDTELPPLYPKQSSDTATLRVTETAASGTTLRWRLRVEVSVTGAGSEYVRTEVFVGACGGPAPLAAGSAYEPADGLLPGQSVDLCVRTTLSAEAPSAQQGTSLTPSVSVVAEQVGI